VTEQDVIKMLATGDRSLRLLSGALARGDKRRYANELRASYSHGDRRSLCRGHVRPDTLKKDQLKTVSHDQ